MCVQAVAVCVQAVVLHIPEIDRFKHNAGYSAQDRCLAFRIRLLQQCEGTIWQSNLALTLLPTSNCCKGMPDDDCLFSCEPITRSLPFQLVIEANLTCICHKASQRMAGGVVCPVCVWKLLCQFCQQGIHVIDCLNNDVDVVIGILSKLIVAPAAYASLTLQ